MTKRFTYVKNNSITQYQALPIQEIGKGKAFHCQGIVDKLNKLSDDNEKLKQQFNYIQNSISEHIKHQKTELGQKALQEIIEDYNEWLLGHKRLQK